MEVMITVVIIGILAAIAIPSYTGHVTRTRRVEAVTALQAVALYEEKARAESGSYVAEDVLVGTYGLKPGGGGEYTPSEYYDIEIDADADTFTASAEGKAGSSQAGDVIFGIDQDGTGLKWDGAQFVPDAELWRSLRK